MRTWVILALLTSSDKVGRSASEAVELCRLAGDPALLGESLDALSVTLVGDGLVAAAAERTLERLALLEGMAPYDPWPGSEQMDIRHMAMDSPLVAGEPAAAVSYGQRFVEDDFGSELVHFIRHGLTIAHTLLGEFDMAVVHAEAMRRGWERAGRPAAGWMGAGALITALLYGLRGDDGANAEWTAFADHLSAGHGDIRAFAAARLALHRGDVPRAGELASAGDEPFLQWGSYLRALQVEIAAVQRDPHVPDLAAEARSTFDRQPWAEAMLLRALARTNDRPEDWRRAADAFAAVGARFEWACTVVLARGAAAGDGSATLAALGCQPPAA